MASLGVGGPAPWRLLDAWGRVHARGSRAGEWRIERDGRRLRGVQVATGRATAWSDQPFAVQADADEAGGGRVSWETRRYRGELRYLATDTAVLVANVLPIEEYLRGVVPLEIGPRGSGERAAVEAQAIAARSYTVVRALEGVTRAWDLTSRSVDQVYGGSDAESAVADAAITATEGIVLSYRGQVVRAPYHSTCGGATAAPDEVFAGAGEGYLRSVSDRVPGTDRAWCEISPRFRWERSWSQQELVTTVTRSAEGRGVGAIHGVEEAGTTASGRLAGLRLATDRGTIVLRGNALRFALATAGGEILPSTYVSADWSATQGLTMRGRGNGHGVGMCQWGAIARARAGADAATILLAYYPGTTLSRVR
ncbi:MAG: SpoIID/LytB domain-containing protein [Gemmatimonadetes bacterium]|nr:SpoIID/LytB domain-containing protein [Gemmatimonadota bacterium]